MFQKLVSHNEDLKRLVDRGYAVDVDNTNHLVIKDIPYLNSEGELCWGVIVAKLSFADKYRFFQHNHQIFFAGDLPYGLDGKPVPHLGTQMRVIKLSNQYSDVEVKMAFSNKPKIEKKYKDHFHKIETYVSFISGPAMQKFEVTPFTFNCSGKAVEDPIFKFRDTLTSRADLTDLTSVFTNDVVAVIGLGGTGSYLLDLLIKTPVREIRGFDDDVYHVHNSFRSPGSLRVSDEKSELGMPKAEVFQERYENFRTGLSLKKCLIDESSEIELLGVTFAFVCVDNGDARSEIFDLLIRLGIPYIDVGLGVNRNEKGSLKGMVRSSFFHPAVAQVMRAKKVANESEDLDNLYKTNIQIAELNALNACIAVIIFKQYRGFYASDMDFTNVLFEIGSLKVTKESDIDGN